MPTYSLEPRLSIADFVQSCETKVSKAWSKAEQMTMVVRYKTCYTNSTEGTVNGSIWKNQQPPTVILQYFCMVPKIIWIAMPKTSLPTSCYSLIVSNLSRLFCLVFSSVPPWHKQFLCTRLAVQTTKVSCRNIPIDLILKLIGLSAAHN